jgi:putative alpha-1,2-mannosidase
MNYKLGLFFIGFGLILFGCAKSGNERVIKETSFTKYVDPFIGTGGHGHTYPGASLPFGMLQVSPDNGTSDWDWCSGYHYSDSITIGFSHLHLSGTGIGDYGDILFMPYTGDVSLDPGTEDQIDSGYRSRFSRESERASPGYYAVNLTDYNIGVELTATKRTGMHQYTFPDSNHT